MIERTITDPAQFPPVIQAMLQDSAERWLAFKDRSDPLNWITITVDCFQVFYLKHDAHSVTGWVCDEGPLMGHEAAEFWAQFGIRARLWLRSSIEGIGHVRAFVKNGNTNDWTFSVEKVADNGMDSEIRLSTDQPVSREHLRSDHGPSGRSARMVRSAVRDYRDTASNTGDLHSASGT